MRILFINPPGNIHRNTGGIETYARDVTAAIAARGHTTRSVNLDPHVILPNLKFRDRIPSLRFNKRYYLWRTSYLDDYRYHNAIRRISNQVALEFRPDLVHSFHAYHYGAICDQQAATVVTCHGLEIEDVPPVRGSLELASGIHCNSRFTCKRVASFITDTGNTRVLSWGIRPSAIQASGKNAKFDLITIGRVVRRKNIESIIKAIGNMPHLRYAVVGTGPDLPRLQALTEQAGIHNVFFLGAVSDQEKQELLSSSRLFVMCPRNDNDADVEGLGLVYYEAHGAGLPVLGAHSGGAPEAIGDAGLLVRNPLNIAEISQAISDALEPENYRRLLEAVSTRQQTHSWTGFIDGLENWYNELVSTR